MICPKCNGEFVEKQYGGQIKIQRCEGCGGILSDSKTLTKMRDEWMADVFLDKGNPKVGKEKNKIGDIDCPQCNNPMEKTFDEEQPHVWLEMCNDCDLIFLDAGELTDLKNLTFMDKFRDLIIGRRKPE